MIIQLHQNLINKIAAGEVVERPASVLKELVENSIDAGADKIDITIEKAGIKKIQVSDNGSGMNSDDASLACDSHTTSKISKVQDLASINSMGFRGEALASISSVSKLTLETKSKEEKSGTIVTIKGGKDKKVEEKARNNGTSISVEDIFFNVPARKKFLKSETTEYKHILVVFFNYAMAFPDIHFTLTKDSKEIYNLPRIEKDNFNAELKVRVHDLFGDKISDNVIEITYNSPYIQIIGLLGHPRIARSRRSYQLIFLNKRPISDNLISKAVYDAYQGLIPKGQYPVFFLFLKINPTKVDVNVHPRKNEVRFDDTGSIFKAVKQAARQTLLKFVQKDTKKALEKYSDFTKKVSKSKLSFKTQIKEYPKKTSKSAQSSKRFNRTRKSEVKDALNFSQSLLKSDKSASLTTTPRSFQVFKEFIIVEKDEKLMMIDQHAAAERVTYEKLLEEINKGKIEKQKLLLPEVIELNKIEFDSLKANKDKLNELGISIIPFGKKSFKIEEIPALIAKCDIKNLIEDIVSELANEEIAQADSFDEVKKHIIATMACHTSIRAGMRLDRSEIDDLINNLLKCKNPYSCPHGRPIIWKITKNELSKKFKRT